MTTTLELDEDNVSTFAKFKYERGSSKTERVFEKTNTKLFFSMIILVEALSERPEVYKSLCST